MGQAKKQRTIEYFQRQARWEIAKLTQEAVVELESKQALEKLRAQTHEEVPVPEEPEAEIKS